MTLPSRPKKRVNVVWVVAITIVAIGVVIALVFVGIWEPFPTGGSTRPSMTLSPASRSGSFATTYIASMRPAGLLPADLSVRLTVNGTATSTAPMASPGSPAQVSANSKVYYVTWFDATQEGIVTSTDTFTVAGSTDSSPRRHMRCKSFGKTARSSARRLGPADGSHGGQRMWATMSSSSRSQYLQTTRSGFLERTTNVDSIGPRTFEMQFGFAHRKMPIARSGKLRRRFSATL